jgi:hypothetical protein
MTTKGLFKQSTVVAAPLLFRSKPEVPPDVPIKKEPAQSSDMFSLALEAESENAQAAAAVINKDAPAVEGTTPSDKEEEKPKRGAKRKPDEEDVKPTASKRSKKADNATEEDVKPKSKSKAKTKSKAKAKAKEEKKEEQKPMDQGEDDDDDKSKSLTPADKFATLSKKITEYFIKTWGALLKGYMKPGFKKRAVAPGQTVIDFNRVDEAILCLLDLLSGNLAEREKFREALAKRAKAAFGLLLAEVPEQYHTLISRVHATILSDELCVWFLLMNPEVSWFFIHCSALHVCFLCRVKSAD